MANEAPQGRPHDGDLPLDPPPAADSADPLQPLQNPAEPSPAVLPSEPASDPASDPAPASPSDYIPATPDAPDHEPPAATTPDGTVPASDDTTYSGYPYGNPGEPAASAATDTPAVDPQPATDAPVPAHPPRADKSDDESDDDEEGGGPVKPFLDHLEDLRWTLIKVVVSLALGMLVCLIAGNRLVSFLTWPLNHAQRMLPASQQRVPLLLGTNEVGRIQMGSVPLPPQVDSNTVSALALVPEPMGGRLVLTLSVQTNRNPDLAEANLVTLKNYGPISAFMVALKLALYGGLVLSSPFVIFFTGQFVLPALKVKEKAFLYRIAGMGSVLFLVGIAFCYLVIVQVALMASVQFSQWMGFGADEWRAEDYISFVCKFMLGMGLSFQLPLVILTLVKIGILDHETLSKYRAYFLVGNLIVSAVVTPSGDPLTMVLMALPLQFLYEASLIIARYWARKDREREAAA